MSGLADITRVRVPSDVVRSVHSHLREAGAAGFEGVGFWAGAAEGTAFQVQAAVVPTQFGQRGEDGVSVIIKGDELFRMNVWLHKNRLTLVAQLHSHPGAAYHSSTDDDYAIMTRLGGLSIVVPNFARQPFSLDEAAIYRLTEGVDGPEWSHLSPSEAHALIEITP
jgi:hypothetical protein